MLLAVSAVHSPVPLRTEIMDPETLWLTWSLGELGFRVGTFIQLVFKCFKKSWRDFRGGLVVKTLHFLCRGLVFNPWLET